MSISMLYNLSREVYRFSKYMIKKNAEECWRPIQYQVLLQKYSRQQKRPKSLSCRSYILVSWGATGEVT